ncbi:hypothetical protein [Paeniglutamicibacter sp. ZC-3]
MFGNDNIAAAVIDRQAQNGRLLQFPASPTGSGTPS